VKAAARSPDCKVVFFRIRPDRPFDELAALQARGSFTGKPASDHLQEGLRVKACELGADAIIVTAEVLWPTQDSSYSQMSGVAIKYRVEKAPSP
jgi:hypothetical protein